VAWKEKQRSSGTRREEKEGKARCGDKVLSRDVGREEGQKKRIRSHGHAGPTARASYYQPYIFSELAMTTKAHYSCWVTVFEDRALQRCVWTSFLWRHFSVILSRSNRTPPTPAPLRHGTAPP
jgi:hypothetical protein